MSDARLRPSICNRPPGDCGQARKGAVSLALLAGLALAGCGQETGTSVSEKASSVPAAESMTLEGDAPPAGSEAAEAIGLVTPPK